MAGQTDKASVNVPVPPRNEPGSHLSPLPLRLSKGALFFIRKRKALSLNSRAMNLAEIERHVRELSPEERFQFLLWVYAHEDELMKPPHDGTIVPEVMEELLLRRRELEGGNVKSFTIDEMSARVREALDEVHRSRH